MDELVFYNGTYLNKGGAAIAQGTFEVLKGLGIKSNFIIDPEPPLEDIFKSFHLKPLYRYSDLLCTDDMGSLTSYHAFNSLLNCVTKSYNKEIRELRDMPIWHIGDSPFRDKRSYLSLFGQIVALKTLKWSIGGDIIVGGISLEYPKTKLGEISLRRFFLNNVDYTFIRGTKTQEFLRKFGVKDEKMSIICDFAFHLDGEKTERSEEISKRIKESKKPPIALVLREYSEGEKREAYITSIHKFVSNLEKYYEVYFVPTSYSFFTPENDLIFYEKILKTNQNKIINIKDLSPPEIISVFKNFDALISARLHGAVLSSLANIPTIHIYEEDKSLEVMDHVFGKDLIPMINFNDLSNAKGINNTIENINQQISRKDELAYNLKSAIDEARTESFQQLQKILMDQR